MRRVSKAAQDILQRPTTRHFDLNEQIIHITESLMFYMPSPAVGFGPNQQMAKFTSLSSAHDLRVFPRASTKQHSNNVPMLFEPATTDSAPVSLEAKRAKVSRSTAPAATKLKSELSLKEIKGVGPKNAQLLTAAGFSDLLAVQKWFQIECSKDISMFKQQLQLQVGIKQKRHRDDIANYIMGLEDQTQALINKYVTLSVEGNISAGKSTFLRGITKHCPDLQDLIHVAPEPVDRWQNVGNHNLLDKFYHDKKRYAYTFQNYIFFTRMMQERDSADAMQQQPYRLLERSVFCDRMVFVESLKDSKLLSEMELSIYDSWFDPVVKMAPTLVPDGFIYLRATPQTCMSRLKHRNRDEETGVDISYLEDLHRRHDAWLYEVHENSAPNLRDEFNQMRESSGERPELRPADLLKKRAHESLTAPKIPLMIQQDVKILNKNSNGRLHSSINHLPALVLDCEKDILDTDAQIEHARKVNLYFEYVKAMRKHREGIMTIDEAMTGPQGGDVNWLRQKLAEAREHLEPQYQGQVEKAVQNALREIDILQNKAMLAGM